MSLNIEVEIKDSVFFLLKEKIKKGEYLYNNVEEVGRYIKDLSECYNLYLLSNKECVKKRLRDREDKQPTY